MSEDLIERSDVIDALKPIAELLSYGLQSDIASALMSIPTIEPKRGEWRFDEKGYFFCSECKPKLINNVWHMPCKRYEPIT